MSTTLSQSVEGDVLNDANSAAAAIASALDRRAWETARRLALVALNDRPGNRQLLKLLHRAMRALGDLEGCRFALGQMTSANAEEHLELILLQAEDAHRHGEAKFYRTSSELAAGYTLEEYQEKMHAEAERQFAQAIALAQTPQTRRQVAQVLRRCRRNAQADALWPGSPAGRQPFRPGEPNQAGGLEGQLRFPDGTPVANATVTLGLAVEVKWPDVPRMITSDMHVGATIGRQNALTTTTDASGRYHFGHVPAGTHAFLAVTLDPSEHDIPTRFVAHEVNVPANAVGRLDATVDEWKSAPAGERKASLPEQITIDGVSCRRVVQQVLHNPFFYDFPRQAVRLAIPNDVDPKRLVLVDSRRSEKPVPMQVVDGPAAVCLTDLPGQSEYALGVYVADCPIGGTSPESMIRPSDDGMMIVDTGVAQYRMPGGEGADQQPPLKSVCGADRKWRGNGRLVFPDGVGVTWRRTSVLDDGPVMARVRVEYELSSRSTYSLTFTAYRGEPYLLVHEVSPELEGARFEFSLREFGNGGRGYLHWQLHESSQNWSDLTATERELARLQESVPWWLPPAGFGYAMAPDGLAEQDFIAVFTLRRGDWIDRAFERIARGPGDEPGWRRELDWPFPEMVGSTISMITAHTDVGGDAFFRFRFFDGERHWGICASSLARNDGGIPELSQIQHKNSSPTIQQFMTWNLDVPDAVTRPHVVARREQLRHLRRKRETKTFGRFWEKIATGGLRHGAADALYFAVGGDPLVAWRKKLELVGVAHARCRMTLMGREFSDMYSPVGARPITKWAEEYDLLAASGVFSADEERLVRSFLILMAHMHMNPDLMNWRHGSRSANFEADRVDVVGTIGVVFHGHPDSKLFTDHAIELMEQSLNTYCTPGSGKWYENPACYYLQASKCRMNLLFHLAQAGLYDPTTLPRLREFLRWGILLLMPPTPHSYELMRDGCDEATYRSAEKVRRIAPIGDHAHLGPWVPEHYALAAKLYRASDPAFADELLWAYQSGGCDGGYFGNLPLLFAQLEEDDLKPAAGPILRSRRLEGFGAVFRGNFGQADETFLLFKQGPGGYRFHRTEGSILLFSNGKPLVYDGGEAGETWRHSTLSFHDVHMPLAPGHVERFYSGASVDVCQGVHPEVLKPGEPIFLSDSCEHELVDVALKRFHEPRPAVARSVWWIKDEYFVIHDELDLQEDVPCTWHLQVVADGHEGDARQGYVFRGRFGTDLQVVLPGQAFTSEAVTQQPIMELKLPPAGSFSMRHVALRGDRPRHYTAVLRPLPANRSRPLVQTRLLRAGDQVVGVKVQSPDGNMEDRLFFHRPGAAYEDERIRFEGKYGAALRRGDVWELLLLDTGRMELAEGVQVRSNGPQVRVVHDAGATLVDAEGTGIIEVKTTSGDSRSLQLGLKGQRQTVRL